MSFPAAIIERTREHFATLARECIEGAKAGDFHVNDLASYIEWQGGIIKDCLAGRDDHTFAFRQMAHLFATGDCVPLFPN